jgi:CRP-like cAMP-binding protein
VRVCKLSQSGKKLTFAILSQGDIVAISALREQFYRMSFEALTDAVVLHISKDRFFEYVANHPQAATGLIALLVKRLTWECNKNVDRRSERVEGRLVKCLSVLVSKFGTRLPITRKDLANYAGTTTETAIRVLGGLKAKGIVSGSRILGEIIVSDPVMLQTYGRTLGLTQTGAGEREFERSGSERKKRSWKRRPA